ncbi:MAG: DUF4386 domain-containing protein [Nitrospinota bacterium]|nr:DUF4386 domain-containing protein [Nitrospinota bacterium]
MTTSASVTSPLIYTRVAGIIFLILLVCGPFSMMYVPTTLIVPEDATATAKNIIASKTLFRMGIISDTIIFLSEVVMVVMLYALFKSVSVAGSMIAAFFRLAMAVIQGSNLLLHFAVMSLLSGVSYLAVFNEDQLSALVMLLLEVHDHGAYIWEAFFGLHCLALGYLIYKSGFFPPALGVLMTIASLGYMTDSLGNMLFPGNKGLLAGIVSVTAIIGEIPFFLWLLIKGVNEEQWKKRAMTSC